MYLGLGKGKFIDEKNIIGIFDLDITSQSHITRKYLNMAEKEGKIINAAEDIPKSFVIENNGSTYLSQMNTATLIKRAEEESINGRNQ